jgi:arylformamidase
MSWEELMKILDISWPINEQMTQYKNREEVSLEPIKTYDNDQVRLTRITMDSHAGTHAEAPAHFIKDGAHIDTIELTRCCGRCSVLDMTFVGDCITDEHLQCVHIEPQSIVLFKTTNSELPYDAQFDPKFVYLSAAGAAYLAEKKVKAVGIDYVGIERDQEGHPTHMVLMKQDIVIIEGLRLAHVHAGNYFFVCLPLACTGIESSPARAVLFESF